ncbi:MAG: dehypoxanthine futalosine cyclase, partial [Prolixibacteraceae bacterium]|nr:dehypoxanthine futalosine cyclase [Prolixibacteraceae bacterium]
MVADKILIKAIRLEPLTFEEGLFIYEQVPTNELMLVANECRQLQVPGNRVGWIIDRNVNITNVCISGCKFCNFHCKINEEAQYITSIDEYCEKTAELLKAGGRQLLMQGG